MTHRVLVVEDNKANLELATDLLEVAGFEVLQAPTAEIGIDLARSQIPDLIVMDVGLPGMDGLEATRILKADAVTQSIPVLATTSHAMTGDQAKALAAGCDGYLTKPINTRTFADTVIRFLPAVPKE
ncbi:response regulator [Candidatus Bipolaricaulota bacterium]|nr:response regulator [Candidatus Bipolaricaulota bacterium]